MRAIRGFWILITLFAAACGSSRPSPPSTGGSGGGPVSITGRERIGWDQPAGDADLLGSLRFAIYVDSIRHEMTDASCSSVVGASGFPCSGQLPPMTSGAHTLQIAAFSGSDAALVEGDRSSPLQVNVSATASTASAAQAEVRSGEAQPTHDGVRLRVDTLAEQLDRPADAAFAPDGRLFIAEQRQVRVLSDTGLQDTAALSLAVDDPSQRLLSIAFDPDFPRTRLVFVLQTIDSQDGPLVLLARYRELRGALGQRAVIFQSAVEGTGDPSGMLRFGPDRRLYIVIGSSEGNGTVFRLNSDGTTPRDQAGTTAAVAGGVAMARGLAWDPRTPLLWIVDDDSTSGHLSGVAMSEPPVRATVRARTELPAGSGSVVFYTADAIPEFRNNALIASANGYILRLRFAEDDATRVLDSEKLLENQVGPIRVLVAGPEGTIYFCTNTALGKLMPSPREK
jgi:glucose/arabinose dehydrogenase